MRYAVTLTKDGDSISVRVPDIPEALTYGENGGDGRVLARERKTVSIRRHLQQPIFH